MAHNTENLLDRQKDSIVLGTYETSAFILSLRSPDEFNDIHSFGYHRIPHIGVYGTDYSLSLPMVLLSFPATTRSIQKLPTDLLAALNLNHIHVPQSNTTDTTTKLSTLSSTTCTPSSIVTPDSLAAHISSVCSEYLHSGCTLSNEQIVAKAIVDFALRAACRRMVLTGINSHCEAITLGSTRMSISLQKSSSTTDLPMDWRQPSIDSEGHISASMEPVETNTADEVKLRSVSFHVEEDSMPVDTLNDAYYNEQIRIVAKKLVNKVLHVACHKLEAMYRRSSIEYLIASTKRMRIDDSPPPPPTLFEAEEHNDSVSEFLAPRPPWGALERNARKKRGRSGSHEVSQLKELRQMKLGKDFQFSQRHTLNTCNSAGSETSRRILSVSRHQRNVPVESNLVKMSSASSLNDAQKLSMLVSDVKRMSISTCSESESDTTLDSEETYTILSALTVNTVQEEEEPQTVGGGAMFYDERASSFQSTIISSSRSESAYFPVRTPASIDTSTLSQESDSTTNLNVIPDMDLFFIIHTHPSPGLCQKFLCNNTNEVNLLYHCWLFPNVPFSPSLVVSNKLEMGLFDPSGVQSIHLDLQDAGIPFGYLDKRTVCIHSCCFSPENAQLQLLTDTTDLYMFYSAARSEGRRVVALHVVPACEKVEQAIRECTQSCLSLRQLCDSLVSSFPRVGHKVLDLVLSFH